MNDMDNILSRRGLLKAGGALVVGFSFAAALSRNALAARGDAAGPPDPQQVDSWIAVHADNTATVYFGKCELGQGNTTSLLQIVGEELDLDLNQLATVRLDTNVTPDQGATSASSSIHRGAPPLRAAAAEARQALLQFASARLGVQPGSLIVTKGVVSVEGQPARRVTYGQLIGDKPFQIKLSGTAPLKPASLYQLVGQSVPRVDIPDKAAGKYVRMQNLRVPGMLHGRIVLPRGQRAFGTGAKPLSVDETSIADIPSARVIRKGDFIGVVAKREWDAVKAARQLKVVWQDTPRLPSGDLHAAMRSAKTSDTVIINDGDIAKGFQQASHVAAATYRGPYQGHLPFSPNCAIADARGDQILVQCGTQNVYGTRDEIADVLGLPHEKVRVQYYESSGTFGRSCYDDAAQAAAIMSVALGEPVRVQFMRWDEHGWDNYGPAHLADVRAAADADGILIAYEYHGWQHGWTTRATVHDIALGKTAPERTDGTTSITVNPINTGSMYVIANRRVVSHAVPMTGLLRGAALRSPLDLNYGFSSEQTIDELAYAVKMDPLQFRRKNIGGQRWMDVLNAVAKAAGWTPRVAAAALSNDRIAKGRGLGLATHNFSYGAAVAEIEVDRQSGMIVVKRLYGALDCGLAVNPGIVESQIVGQMVQATSRALKEEILFDEKGVTSLDWNSYPILRFAEAPEVVPVVVQRLEEPSTGAGEEVMGATVAAIANAFFDATGVRLRQYPMTPDRVKQAFATRSASRG
jgi:CO/xanthine dehydrogenase Mo-binding subunit